MKDGRRREKETEMESKKRVELRKMIRETRNAVHPKAQIAQNNLMRAILGTFRNSSLARSHLCLSLLRVAFAAAIRRVSSAMRFRCSPVSHLREWIDESLIKGWAWGKMLSSDLKSFGLLEL